MYPTSVWIMRANVGAEGGNHIYFLPLIDSFSIVPDKTLMFFVRVLYVNQDVANDLRRIG